MGKPSLAIGFAAGYVLGAQAGRERYEQIAAQARAFTANPRVQETTANLQAQVTGLFRQGTAQVRGKVDERRSGTTDEQTTYDVVEIPTASSTAGAGTTSGSASGTSSGSASGTTSGTTSGSPLPGAARSAGSGGAAGTGSV